jgi:photosystem II stability/assembly factor-like uncharacterized protein
MKGFLTVGSSAIALASLLAHAQNFEYRQGGSPGGIWTTDANHAWVAADCGRIRYTTDGGQTWTTALTPDDVRVQLRGIQMIDVGGPQLHGYCVGEEGIVLHSTNDGQSWTKVTGVVTEAGSSIPAELHQLHFFNGTTGWAVGDNGAFALTIDSGATWSPPPTYPPNFFSQLPAHDVYDIHFFSTSNFVIVGDYGYTAYTADGGNTWSEFDISEGLLCPSVTSHDLELWAVDFDGTVGTLVGGTGTNRGYIFRSSDSGQTWTQEPCIEYPSGGTVGYPLPTQYGLEMFNAVDGVSVGYGQSTSIRQAAVFPNDLCGAGCTPGGEGWLEMGPEAGVKTRPSYTWLMGTAPTNLWGVGAFGAVRHSVNSGQTWADVGTAHWERIESAEFLSSTVGVIAGQRLTIYRTITGGQRFALVHGPSIGVIPGGWFFQDVDSGNPDGSGNIPMLAVGSAGNIARSANSGATWAAVTSGTAVDLPGVAFTPGGSRVFAVGADGVVRRSDDAGQTWGDGDPADNIPSTIDLYDVAFVTDVIGIAVGSSRSAYATVDAGATWQALAFAGTSTETLRAVATDIADTVVVGDQGKVYYYDLATAQFVPVSVGVPVDPAQIWNDVELVPGSNDVFIAGENGVVVRFNGSTWSAPKPFLGDGLVDLEMFSSASGFLVGRRFGVAEWK